MVRWIVRAVVSGVVLALLLAFVPFGAVREALGRVRPWVWTGSLAIFFAGHYANAVKLKLLVGPGAPSTRVMVQAQYAGLAANLALPGLAGGDLVRAGYLAPVAGLKRIAIASVADRVIDTATLLGLVVVALPWAGLPGAIADVVRPGGWWVAAGLGAAALAGAIGARLLGRTRAGQEARNVWRELSGRRASLLVVVLISAGVQSLFVLTNAWLAGEAGVDVGLSAWFVAWPLSKLVAVLPVSLGGLGVREATLVSLLAPYGADSTAVLASGLLWQAVLAVSGLAGLLVTQMLRRRDRREKTSEVFLKIPPRSFPPSSGHRS